MEERVQSALGAIDNQAPIPHVVEARCVRLYQNGRSDDKNSTVFSEEVVYRGQIRNKFMEGNDRNTAVDFSGGWRTSLAKTESMSLPAHADLL